MHHERITPLDGVGLAVAFALLALAAYAFAHALPAGPDRVPWAMTCVVLVLVAEAPVVVLALRDRR